MEVAGIVKTTKDKALAQSFLTFMISPAFQDIIPENNWMMPAAKTSAPLNRCSAKLVNPEKTLVIAPEEVAAQRKSWIDEWLAAMSMK